MSRAPLALAIGFCALLGAVYALAQGEPVVIEVTPEPIGAAAGLVATRGVGDGAIRLPDAGLVAAPESPDVRTRADRTTFQAVQLTASVSTSATRTQLQSQTTASSTSGLNTAKSSTTASRLDTTASSSAYLASQSKIDLASKTNDGVLRPSTERDRIQLPPRKRLDPPPRRRPPPRRPPSQPLPPPVGPLPPPTPTEGPGSPPYEEPAQSNALEWLAAQQRVYEELRIRMQELRAYREERRARQEAEQREREDFRGPSALRAVNLLENLHVDRNVELRQNEVLEIANEAYHDANPTTGLFYYLPRRYDIAWDPDAQYAMTVIYGMAGRNEGEGEVFMAARLQAGVDTHELEVAKELLRAYLRRHADEGFTRFRELRPAPLSATSDVELFGGADNEFTVPPEKISVQRVSGFLEAIDVSWATDVRRLLNVESLLRTDAGIHGTVTFHTAGEESFSRSLPLEINVTSPQAFGRIRFERERGWHNRTLYPVRLHTLHALLIAPEDSGRLRKDDPVIYSWRLGDALIPPGAAVRWNAGAIPPWLDGRAKLFWVDYSVDGSCEACDDRVFDERFIPELPSSRSIIFTTGDAFEATGAERITVHLRSPFLDPQRDRILQHPGVRLSSDGEEYSIAKLFLTDREFDPEHSHEPFYEYFVEVTLRDGTTYRSADWTPSRKLDFLLGSAGLRASLGEEVWEALTASDGEGA